MPQIGELIKEKELKPNSLHRRTFVWTACSICGQERWVRLKCGKPERTRCNRTECRKTFLRGISRKNTKVWKGGRLVDPNGYIRIWVDETDFFAPMRNKNGYVSEHRLVMAKYLGRNLQGWEQVHHRNGEKHNNHIRNLEIIDKANHLRDHSKGYKDGYRKGYLDGLKGAKLELA